MTANHIIASVCLLAFAVVAFILWEAAKAPDFTEHHDDIDS